MKLKVDIRNYSLGRLDILEEIDSCPWQRRLLQKHLLLPC